MCRRVSSRCGSHINHLLMPGPTLPPSTVYVESKPLKIQSSHLLASFAPTPIAVFVLSDIRDGYLHTHHHTEPAAEHAQPQHTQDKDH